MKPGREVGNTLARLLDMVLEEPQRNTREYLLAHLGQKQEGHGGIRRMRLISSFILFL